MASRQTQPAVRKSTAKAPAKSPKKRAAAPAGKSPRGRTAAPASKAAGGIDKAKLERALKAYAALDEVSGAIMMVDRDFMVTYVNKTTTAMLTKHADEFRKLWPTFDPARMIGSCIDMFHKDPRHQRRMLDDPSRLPHRTDISVGSLKFSLCVLASYDAKGNYDGNILEWANVTELRRSKGQVDAINRAQAVIEFSLDGRILDANENFLRVMGYSMEELRGQHHSMFVDGDYRQSAEYKAFWEKLGHGEYDAGQYKRLGRGGKEVWIQASYNPILDQNGRPFMVVKYATDITDQKRAAQALQLAVEETQQVVASAKEGDFSRSIPLDGKVGAIEALCSGVNDLLAVVSAVVDQTQGVVTLAKEGDLTQRVPLEDKEGSIAALCSGVNSLVENMAEVVGQIKQSTESITTASQQIAAGNADLSQRTEEQAASLAETAASMEELTATVKQNAENAKQANQLAVGASDIAAKGGTVVGEVVTTMGSINDASKKIVDIISVIDGIAFQTNILALNAAVEAARAGEQGRGFAVVASEVRNLAQRSASAAKEIKGLIGDSVAKVESGSKLVAQAGETMDEVVRSVKRVTDIMAEITAASMEQSQGIEQVNQAINQMDTVTQQNAALVDEAAAAASSMEEQARALSDSVSAFRLVSDEERTASVRRAAPPAKAAAIDRRVPARAVEAAATRPAQARAVPQRPAAPPARPAAPPAKPAADASADEPVAKRPAWSEF